MRPLAPNPAWLIKVFVLAAAYYVVGRLALLLAIPPGYATAIWPAAGIGLVGILLLGYRAWPGILLGSFLVNIWTSFDTTSAASILKSVSLAAGIGAGASLQAMAGAFLVRRFVGFPNPLDQERDVIKFMVLGGPVSCLASATWGVTGLLLAGAISRAEYPFNWWTWWVGDTMGVLIAAPLALIWTGEPREVWRQRRISVGVPLGLMLAVAIVFFVYASAWEQDEVEDRFEEHAETLANAIKRSQDGHLEVLHSLESLYASSNKVERRDFRAFVQRAFARHPGLHALSWNPRVPDARRADYEKAARRDGYPDFQITEQDSKGQLVRAARRSEYVTVYYVEPYEGNEGALGFDVASNPTRLEALNRARDTGKPTATARVRLVQGSGQEFAFLVFLPIYRNGPPHDTVEQRREHLQGFATAVFRARDIVETSLQGLEKEGIEFWFSDGTAPLGERLLSIHQARLGPANQHIDEQKKSSAKLHWATTYEMAGRQWALVFSATPAYLLAQRSWQGWGVLAGALLVTALLEALLLIVTGRAAKVELQVAERTAELSESNTSLTREIAERRRAEEKLRASEEKFRGLANAAADAIISADSRGKIIYFNPQAERIFGYLASQVVGRPLTILMPEQYHEAHRQGFERFLSSGESRLIGKTVELVGRRSDGGEFPLELSLASWKMGMEVFFTAIIRDITERKQAEQRQADFTAMVAHDLRSPLMAVVSGAALLEDGLYGPVNEEQKKWLARIQTDSRNLVNFVNEFLDFSKLEAGHIDLVKKDADLSRLAQNSVDSYLALARDKKISLRSNVDPGLTPVRADPRRLAQVLNNLLSNAIKFTPEGGTIEVGASSVDGVEVRLWVKDDGVGIAPEEIGHLFEKYRQTTSGKTHNQKGTGLGLVICKMVVEAHGGRIWVESEERKGAIISFTLPIRSAGERSPS